jgi:hypothetical protein
MASGQAALEKLHLDNSDKSRAGRHVRDNPVNKDTGQESAATSSSSAFTMFRRDKA